MADTHVVFGQLAQLLRKAVLTVEEFVAENYVGAGRLDDIAAVVQLDIGAVVFFDREAGNLEVFVVLGQGYPAFIGVFIDILDYFIAELVGAVGGIYGHEDEFLLPVIIDIGYGRAAAGMPAADVDIL